jgi:uncharacterized glyoxalase superfamily protein PhnB
MTVRRIVPHIESVDPRPAVHSTSTFWGLEVAMDMGWIVIFASPENRTAQIIVLRPDDATAPQPDFTVEVADVDATHARAIAQGLPVVYPLTDEPWGVRRFFLRDPNGKIANIMSHQTGA